MDTNNEGRVKTTKFGSLIQIKLSIESLGQRKDCGELYR